MPIISKTMKDLEQHMQAVAASLTEHPMVAEKEYKDLQDAVSRLAERFQKLVPAPDSNPSQRIRFAALRMAALVKIKALQDDELMEMGDVDLGEET